MQRQYAAVKQQYPDVIVLFRMGDFYEMFDEDAEKAAPILEIVLTRRDGRPMCGVPYHALERYVARLLAAGLRVAVCDQMEDPKKAKGLVRREVTRVVSPGTVLEDSFLPASANNFLAALAPGTSASGVAVADVSTGEFLVTQFAGERHLGEALAEIERLRPAECVISDRDEDLSEPLRAAGCRLVTPVSRNGAFAAGARQTLLEHFGVASLLGFGCEELEQAQEAAALILTYLRASNPGALAHLRSLSTYSAERYMQLDSATRRNLELTASQNEDSGATLLRVVDCTRTPMGARLLRRWLEQPLLDLEAIRERQAGVRALVEDILLRGDIRDLLSGVQDVERIAARASSGVAGPRDLLALARSLERTARLSETALRADASLIRALAERCRPPEGLAEEIAAAIDESAPLHVREGGVIRPGYSSELDALRDVAHGGREWIARIESQERERTGIKSLKVGYNSVFGYYIEVSKANTALVPDHYIRKQTTTNAERYITPELKEHETTVLGAQERAVALEQELFAQVRGSVAARAEQLLSLARAVAELDALASLAETAHVNRWVCPEVDGSDEILVQAGRHPVVEKSLGMGAFVPNDVKVDTRDDCLLIITGPNMAGKSTYLRQTALIVLLAQVGSFVPADRAKIGVVDRIFTRIGARDELASARSTFMVEMTETANILNNATSRSLVLLDEIGRGTSTFDGLSIAWAVAEFLAEARIKTLFATHYHHLNQLASRIPGVRNYRVAVREEADRIIWLHRIMPGGTDRSYGIQVARLAGLPEEVVARAQEVLRELEEDEHGTAVSPRRSPAPAQVRQLTLFEAAPSPVVEKLKKMDISTMTPVEALTVLWQLQKEAAEE